MNTIPRYKCLLCGDIVESSPRWHQMNWCSCNALGVDDHAHGQHRVCGDLSNYAQEVEGVFIPQNELNATQINEQMNQEMENMDLFARPDDIEWEFGVEDSIYYEYECGCGEHKARKYRDECHHYDGSWWRSYCLIEHLLDKYEGGLEDEKSSR